MVERGGGRPVVERCGGPWLRGGRPVVERGGGLQMTQRYIDLHDYY